MTVSITALGLGTIAGDGTGDAARTGGGTINTNFSNLKTVVEVLQSGKWEIDNTTETLALGEKVIANSHAGITKTLPAATAIAADDYNDIWIINSDSNSDITIAANVADSMTVGGATQSSPATHTLAHGYMAIAIYRSASHIDLFEIPITAVDLADVQDVDITSIATGEILKYDGSNYINNTLEEANIVARDEPAMESTPYIVHDSLSTKSSGTETIDITTQPSVYLPIGGDNVTIHLDTPTLSLPVRGLSDVRLAGKVFVKMNGAYSGLSVTSDAGTKIGTFPKGTAPAASGEWGILAWEYFDDGAVDFMWAEWLNDD